jgi:putative salt-induced outer membrane protein YdiY
MRTRSLLSVIVVLVPAFLAAQSPPPQPPAHEGTLNVSFINQTGNTDITTIGYDQTLILRPSWWRWTFTEYSGIIYGKNDGKVLAERYRAGVKADMAISPMMGLYASEAFDRNVFSALASRYTTSAGLTALLVDVPADKAKLELGLARIRERNTSDVVSRSFAGRIAGEYRHNFSAVTYAAGRLEVLPNLKEGEDLRINGGGELVAPISSHIGLKSAYLVQYDRLPAPGKKKTDTTLQTGLQISF